MASGLDIGTLSGRIELEDRMSSALDLLEGKLGQLDERFGGFGKRVAEAAAGFTIAEVAIAAVKEVAHLAAEGLKEIFDVTLAGAGVADVEKNFEHMTQSVGRLGDTLTGALREGTHNTITNFELMKTANKDLAAGMNLTDQQFGTLAKGAFALAQATGTDVKTALDTMNDAMLTGRTRSLQMLTGKIDLAKAENDFAAKLDTTSDRLTEEGKLEAARAAILEKVGEVTTRLGEQTDGLDELVAQARATWQGFLEDLGKTIATSPVMMAGLTGIKDALTEAFGGSTQGLVKTVAGYIDDLAIKTLGLAEYVVDAVGVIGVEWNAAIVVMESVKAGWEAIAYVAESALLLIEKGINAVSFGALDEQVKSLEADVEGWYNAMAESERSLQDHKKAEEDWAVATGNVKDKIEGIRQKMLEAQKTQEETTKSTNELKRATDAQAASAGAQAAAVDRSRLVLGQTQEEAKKFAEALKELNAVGGDWQVVLNSIDGETVAAVRYYLDAGVALDKLATAYGLTDVQAKAIERTWKEDTEAAKKQVKAAEELGKAWNDYYHELADMGATDLERANHQALAKYEATVQKLQEAGIAESKFYDEAWDLYRKDVEKNQASIIEKDQHSKAYLDGQIREARETYTRMQEHSDQYAAADIQNQGKIVQSLVDMRSHWGEVTGEIQKQVETVRTLSGEVITLAEAEARRQQGGTFNVTSQNFEQQLQSLITSGGWNPSGMGSNIDINRAYEYARKGYSFQEILEIFSREKAGATGQIPPPHGPRIPGFREGGIGDFGEGTLAMLHGREAVMPLDSKTFGGDTFTFYINGTATDVARQVSDEIMRRLKSRRQLARA